MRLSVVVALLTSAWAYAMDGQGKQTETSRTVIRIKSNPALLNLSSRSNVHPVQPRVRWASPVATDFAFQKHTCAVTISDRESDEQEVSSDGKKKKSRCTSSRVDCGVSACILVGIGITVTVCVDSLFAEREG